MRTCPHCRGLGCGVCVDLSTLPELQKTLEAIKEEPPAPSSAPLAAEPVVVTRQHVQRVEMPADEPILFMVSYDATHRRIVVNGAPFGPAVADEHAGAVVDWFTAVLAEKARGAIFGG